VLHLRRLLLCCFRHSTSHLHCQPFLIFLLVRSFVDFTEGNCLISCQYQI
jgi:hypothetical protein